MRILLASALLFLLATFAPPRLFAPPVIPDRLQLRFVPIGSGLWEMESNDPRFGGISALHVRDGAMLAVSDTGWVFRAPIAEGRVPLRATFLNDGPGTPRRKRDRDAEAAAVANGKLWVSFENRNAVWRYGLPTLKGEAGARPASLRGWPRKEGAETMLRLPDGRFLFLSEGRIADGGTSEGELFDRDPAAGGKPAIRLRYRPPDGFKLTDAALLSGGRLLFLNRRFSFPLRFSAKLTIARVADIEEGAVISGAEIADLSPLAENMEALAVTQENGRDTVWVASDDNFSPRQRTLLLKLRLAD